MIDPKELTKQGTPNICFSILSEGDDREEEYKQQRIKQGFDDSETWSLDTTVAQFLLPRLKRYQEIASEVLDRDIKLISDIDDVIKALELKIRDMTEGAQNKPLTDQEYVQMNDGINKLSTVFQSLWW